MIGKTEEVILLALLRQGEASPASITAEIKLVTPIHLGAVYTTLTRMVDKGWVKRRDPDKRGRGDPRGYFSILPEGRTALRNSLNVTNQIASGIHL